MNIIQLLLRGGSTQGILYKGTLKQKAGFRDSNVSDAPGGRSFAHPGCTAQKPEMARTKLL